MTRKNLFQANYTSSMGTKSWNQLRTYKACVRERKGQPNRRLTELRRENEKDNMMLGLAMGNLVWLRINKIKSMCSGLGVEAGYAEQFPRVDRRARSRILDI